MLKSKESTPTLPADFCSRILNDWQNGDKLIEALDGSTPISVRLHGLKYSEAFKDEQRAPWNTKGRYLASRPSFTLDPLFHAGAYYP